MISLKFFSRMSLITISILSMVVILSCSPEEGKEGAAGKDGVNLSNNTGIDVTNVLGQVIATSVITPINFDNEITDDSNAFNTSTSEWKIPSTGFYNIIVKVSFSNTFPSNISGVLYIYKNGVLFKSTTQPLQAASGISISTNTKLNQNDIIKTYVLHNSLTSDVLQIGVNNCFFSGYRIY